MKSSQTLCDLDAATSLSAVIQPNSMWLFGRWRDCSILYNRTGSRKQICDFISLTVWKSDIVNSQIMIRGSTIWVSQEKHNCNSSNYRWKQKRTLMEKKKQEAAAHDGLKCRCGFHCWSLTLLLALLLVDFSVVSRKELWSHYGEVAKSRWLHGRLSVFQGESRLQGLQWHFPPLAVFVVYFFSPSLNLPSPTGKREAGWSREEKGVGGVCGTWGRGYSALAPKFPKSRKSSLGLCFFLTCFFSTSQGFTLTDCEWVCLVRFLRLFQSSCTFSLMLTKLAWVDPWGIISVWAHCSATSCSSVREVWIVAG